MSEPSVLVVSKDAGVRKHLANVISEVSGTRMQVRYCSDDQDLSTCSLDDVCSVYLDETVSLLGMSLFAQLALRDVDVSFVSSDLGILREFKRRYSHIEPVLLPLDSSFVESSLRTGRANYRFDPAVLGSSFRRPKVAILASKGNNDLIVSLLDSDIDTSVFHNIEELYNYRNKKSLDMLISSVDFAFEPILYENPFLCCLNVPPDARFSITGGQSIPYRCVLFDHSSQDGGGITGCDFGRSLSLDRIIAAAFSHASDLLHQHKGFVYLIAGPSAAGKSTLMKHVQESTEYTMNRYELMIKHTDRTARWGERDGVDFHFLNPQHWNNNIELNTYAMLYSSFARHYGVPIGSVQQATRGFNVMVPITDPFVAVRLQKRLGAMCRSYLILPPRQVLQTRLRTDPVRSPAQIAARTYYVNHAYDQFSAIREHFDYCDEGSSGYGAMDLVDRFLSWSESPSPLR